jgi:TolB-like protein
LKSNIYFFHIKILVLITLLIVLVVHRAAADETSVRIAVTPFTLNAPEDMQYLKTGIQDMLESRLSQDEKVMVVNDEETAQAMQGIEEPIDENEAREIGKRVGADVVLIGSLTVFGSSASLDARLVDVTGAQPTRSFSQQSQTIDDLVPKINALAADIGTIIVSAPAVAAQTAPAYPTPAPDDDSRKHPEKITEETTDSQSPTSAGIAGAVATGAADEFWKSRRFKILMNGIALGDVDGDGKTETVIITPDKVMIYRVESGKLFKIDEFETGGFRILIGVDVADINGNGYAEIFVTAQNTQKNRVYSDVFEYDGDAFVPVVKSSPRKYRVIEVPMGNPVLLGQKHVDKKVFSGAVYILNWEAGEYQPGDPIGSAAGFNLMGFTYGDATNTGENSVVAYDDWDKLTLIGAKGEVLWKGSQRYGGSTLSFSIGRTGRGEDEFQYLPMRVLIHDTDGDGRNEVVAVKNYETARNALARFRKYNDAEIIAFDWDGVGLSPKWQTKKITGYMRDFAIGDHDNDGRDELVVALVLKEGLISMTTPRSVVIAYQL